MSLISYKHTDFINNELSKALDRKIEYIDPFDFNNDLLDKVNKNVFSIGFIRLWTFINKYGEVYSLDKKIDDTVPTKHRDGLCVSRTQNLYSYLLEEYKTKQNEMLCINYVEGISTVNPFLIHCINGLLDTRHNSIIDSVWTYSKIKDTSLIEHHGVSFDLDLVNHIASKQLSGDLTILNYLLDSNKIRNPGKNKKVSTICLSCAELLNGDFADYPITEEDVFKSIFDDADGKLENYYLLNLLSKSVKILEYFKTK